VTALAYRQVLPLSVTERLVELASDAVREHLVSRHALAPETAIRLAQFARERATVDLVDQADASQDIGEFVARLNGRKALTPSLLLRAGACSPPPAAPAPGAGPTAAPRAAVAEAVAPAAPASAAAGFACVNPAQGRCTEYAAGSATLAEGGGPEGMGRICGVQGGTWQATLCPAEGVLGTCVTERSTIRCVNEACVASHRGRGPGP